MAGRGVRKHDVRRVAIPVPIFRPRLRVPLLILGRAYSRRYLGLATDDPFVSISWANR
jgi:hypothetical protein